MKGGQSFTIKKLISGLVIIMGLAAEGFSSQRDLSGIWNQPSSHVITIGVDRITVNDVTGFGMGDTVLLIQMQGAEILTAPLGSYGTYQNKLGEPGAYEFLVVQSVDVPGKQIVFLNNILYAYNPAGNVQVIRVPYFNSATVTSTLTCNGWNPATGTGGVLAFFVGRTLKLNADIDLSGKGFKGAKDTVGDGICTNLLPANLQEFYPYSYMNAGLKGEGAAIHTNSGTLLFPSAAKGLGPNWTGGGGGNGRYSGGGGGGNSGAGGVGGFEDCATPFNGGNGGFSSINAFLLDRIYFGGGGGASTSASGISPAGGNGGGIIIIIADTLIGNGGRILANGGLGGNATINGGAGGGGAGGSIALSINSYGSTNLVFSAAGGNGGDNPNDFGEGGGGGGGLIWLGKDVTPNVTVNYPGGLAGGITAFPGFNGEKKIGYRAVLNGFLFNSVRSTVTGDQTDSICSNMTPRKISGTNPVGGTPPYTYIWEKSYDQISWTTLVNDPDAVNYTPTVTETTNVYFRRTVTDSSVPALVDVSKPAKIIVQPFIKNNIVGPSDTICYAQHPPVLNSLAPVQDGNGRYQFFWEVSIDSSYYSIPVNTNNTESYNPPGSLLLTSWYRRTVVSGRCIDSSAIARITVLPSITGNTITSGAEQVCQGATFTNLEASVQPVLAGGDNIYRYKWESSADGSTGWSAAPGVNNNPGYNPDEFSAPFPGSEYFRRIVYSGAHDVCVKTSGSVRLTELPAIANNTISVGQTICSGSTPASFIGNQPINGDGINYNYLWQQKTKTLPWGPASGSNNQKNYSPSALTDSTWFRRVVTSYTCSDTSNVIVVNVHKPITNNNVKLLSGVKWDTTICSGATPRMLTGTDPSGGTNLPGDYAFQWELSFNNKSGVYAPITGASGRDFQPPALTNLSASAVHYYYKRSVTSGLCSSMSDSIITVKVLPKITANNISPDKPATCFNTSAHLTGSVLTGGEGGIPTWLWQQSPDGSTWLTAAGISNEQSYTSANLITPMQFRRIIQSGPAGCCRDTSQMVAIGINPLPTGTITNATDTTCEGTSGSLNILITGNTASPWAVVYNENSQVRNLNTSSSNTTLQVSPTVQSGNSDSFSYTLASIKDNNGCDAVILSGLRTMVVYKVPDSNAGPDASVCGPIYTLEAEPGSGVGTWYLESGPGATTFSDIHNPNGTISVDSTGVAWSAENIYNLKWKEVNWNCKDSASVTIKFYKRTGAADAGPDKDLYTFDNVDTLRGVKPMTGTGKWSLLSGSGTISNDSIVTGLSKGVNIFEWDVTNGACISKDQVVITVHELKIPEGFSPNNDGINDEFVIQGLDVSYNDVSLRIVNSTGAEVFFTGNMNGNEWTNWKGQSEDGTLPEGTYYYLLTIKSKRTNAVFKKGGFIILKRYNSQ